LDRDRLAELPTGYRHLAYLQIGLGYEVKRRQAGTPGLGG